MLDFSTSTVTEAPRESLNRFFRLLCSSPVVESQDSDGILYWHSEIPHPWFNGVLLNRLPAGNEKHNIVQSSAYFKARGVKVHTLWPGSADRKVNIPLEGTPQMPDVKPRQGTARNRPSFCW